MKKHLGRCMVIGLMALSLLLILNGCSQTNKSTTSSSSEIVPTKISFVKRGYSKTPFYWLYVSSGGTLGKDTPVMTIFKTQFGKVVGIQVPSKYDELGKIAKFKSLDAAYKAILKESKIEFDEARKAGMSEKALFDEYPPEYRAARLENLKKASFGADEVTLKGELETDSTGNNVGRETINYNRANLYVGGQESLSSSKNLIILTGVMSGGAQVYDKTFGGYFEVDGIIVTETNKKMNIALDGMNQKHVKVKDD